MLIILYTFHTHILPLSCFYDNNEDSCQPKGPTATTEYKSTLIWLLCDFCKDCGTVTKNFNNNKKEISCCPKKNDEKKEASVSTPTPVSTTTTTDTCAQSATPGEPSCGTTSSASTPSCAPSPTPTVSSVSSSESNNCKLNELKEKLKSANCEVLTNLTSDIPNGSNNCPCAGNDEKIQSFVNNSMDNCKMEAKELIKEVNAQVIDTKSYEEMEPYIKELSLKLLCLLFYKRLVEEFILLHNFLESIINNLKDNVDVIKSCNCGSNVSGNNCSIEGKCLCSIFYKLFQATKLLHDRYCKIIGYMNGECDEDLYKVIPSLSLTRSVILLTKYFNEYKGKIDEESSCATQAGTANGKCPCHRYSSKLDEILTSLCKVIDDDTSDDVLSSVIQFVSYVAKDEYSEVKKFDYEKVHNSIKGHKFNSENKIGCCCCRSRSGTNNCCCTGGTCPCSTGSGECCTDGNCCCKNGCCCTNGINTETTSEIKLCDCCCKHENGKGTGCTCTPVAENKCYCCCLCDDATCECTPAASTNGLKKCCCTNCGAETGSGCCKDCDCNCNQNIKICNCCTCITNDGIISCCELTPGEACAADNCCCSPADCKCSTFVNGSECLNDNGAGTCGGNVENYCISPSNSPCTLDICRISCCMRNLTKNGTNGCLMTIVKDMKNFSKYLERIKGCNGATCTACTCPDCCCKTLDDGQCCDLDCRVKKMFTQIFNTSTRNGNGYKGEPVSICNGGKCIFCILCCLKNNAESIQTNYKKCNAAGCCNITSTCNNTNTTTGCTASGNTACTTTTGSCTTNPSPATAECKCQCKQICPECTDTNCCEPPCSTCKFSPSSIFSCIKKLYQLNNYHTIKRNSFLIPSSLFPTLCSFHYTHYVTLVYIF